MLSLPYFFEGIDNAKLNQAYESNVLTVKGLEDEQIVTLSVIGGAYTVDSGDGFTPYLSRPMMVGNGAKFRVSLTTGKDGGTVHEVRLKIGDHVIRYQVVTMVTIEIEQELPPCKNCGGRPKEPNFGACSEFYGHSWQSGDISCENADRPKDPCCNGVGIEFEADDDTCNRTMQLKHMWIILNTPNKCNASTTAESVNHEIVK